MKKHPICNFIAVLTHQNDEVTCLPLFCREYHANKLAYFLSRTASRSCFKKVEVLAFEKFCEDRELTMKFLRGCVNNLIAREV